MKNNTIVIVLVVAVVLILVFFMMNKKETSVPQTVIQQPQDNIWTALGGAGDLIGALNLGGNKGGSVETVSTIEQEPILMRSDVRQSQEYAAQEGLNAIVQDIGETKFN